MQFIMRKAVSFLILSVLTSFGIETLPNLKDCDAVLTGTVISNSMVAIESDRDTKWELWKAEVRVNAILKKDTNLNERVFIYYEQNYTESYTTENGGGIRTYVQACPSRPRIATGDTKKFYCIRRNKGLAKGMLFISQGGWVTPP